MVKSMGLGPDTDSWRVMYCSYVLLNHSHSIKKQTIDWIIRIINRGRRGRDRMVVGFTTTYAISVYPTDVVSSNLHQRRCTTLCDTVCQWLNSTNKTDRHDI